MSRKASYRRFEAVPSSECLAFQQPIAARRRLGRLPGLRKLTIQGRGSCPYCGPDHTALTSGRATVPATIL
jgi:hypothetical protein